MKVWIEQDTETGLWFEVERGAETGLTPLEIPDAIMAEWRYLNARLDEIADYFHKSRMGLIESTPARPYCQCQGVTCLTHGAFGRCENLELSFIGTVSRRLYCAECGPRLRSLAHPRQMELFGKNR